LIKLFKKIIIKKNYFTFELIKFAFGGLDTSVALKMVEDAALNDEVKLQNGFEAVDECSSKSS